jgi:peptidoglycan/LPS O-acetylase OafA/YrhL
VAQVRANGRISSLDGLRGAAVLLVIAAHFTAGTIKPTGIVGAALTPIESAGDFGVELFFALSGYLITTILLKERLRTGTVDLRKFYLRRALRIWPAYYVYLAAVLVLTLLGVIHVTGWEFASAGLFIWDYARNVPTWFLAHTWSLAIEEQFYVLWSAALLWLKPRVALCIAVIAFLAVPVGRYVTYRHSDQVTAPTIFHMFHARCDSLLVGAVIALAVVVMPAAWERVRRTVARLHLWAPALVVVFASESLTRLLGGSWQLTFGLSIENLAVAALLITALSAGHPVARMLSWRPLRLVGVVSFSLYLWQQLFAAGDPDPIVSNPVVALLCMLSAAIASHVLVERPLLRVKTRFETARVTSVDGPLVESAPPSAPSGRVQARANSSNPVSPSSRLTDGW